METLRVRPDRRAWLIGGALLAALVVAQLVVVFVPSPGPGFWSALWWVVRVLFLAALTVFAVGLRAGGSVVERRPVGIIALVATGTIPIVQGLVGEVTSSGPEMPGPEEIATAVTVSTAFLVAQLVAAVIAVVAVARAGAVPRPWHLVPAWALAAAVVPEVVIQLVVVASSSSAAQSVLVSLSGVAGLLRVLAVAALAVTAILLAIAPTRGEPEGARSVQIYPPVD